MSKILSVLEMKSQRQVVVSTLCASLFLATFTIGLVHIIYGSLFPGSVYPSGTDLKLVTFPLALSVCMPTFYGMFYMSLRVWRKNEELLQLANHDPLTGIFNRRAFAEQFLMQTRKARRNDLAGILMVADVDRFKNINDTYGHETGDNVLTHLAIELRKLAGHNSCVARLGGEEFGILCFDVPNANSMAYADGIRIAVENSAVSNGGHPIKLTISIGFCMLNSNSVLTKSLGQADAALYLAKRNGRNRTAQYNANIPPLTPDEDQIIQLGTNIASSQLASSN